MSTPIVALCLLFLIACCLAVVLRRLALSGSTDECGPEWVRDFSVARYRPMLRLLATDDFEYLATQEGILGGHRRRLRTERRRIFRGYLNNLVADFNRLYVTAKVLVLHGEEDRSEVAGRLLHQRLLFLFGVFSIETRLVLHALGIGTIDVRDLLGSIEQMRLQVVASRGMFAS